jgi:hypothetical protein
MEKFSEWLTTKFEHPLSPMFFFLGALLLLLGVSNGLKLPVIDQLASDANFRWVCLVLGVICFGLSIFIYYRPPKDSDKSKKKANDLIETLPEEWKMSFSGRRGALSANQDEILTYIIHNGYRGELIGQDVIQEIFMQYGGNELLYRLEHLRLLGFLKRQKIGKDTNGNERFVYALSPDFIKEIGDPKSFAEVSITQNIYAGHNSVIKGVKQIIK